MSLQLDVKTLTLPQLNEGPFCVICRNTADSVEFIYHDASQAQDNTIKHIFHRECLQNWTALV